VKIAILQIQAGKSFKPELMKNEEKFFCPATNFREIRVFYF